MAAKKSPAKKMAAPKTPAKKTAVGVKAPAKKMAAPAKSVSKKQNNSGGPGTSNPLKSGEEYLKPQRFMSGRSDKRTPKNTSGDLASERATMRQARQRNESGRSNLEQYGAGILAVTYRDWDGKLKNTYSNTAYGANPANVPKSGYIWMDGDNSPKKKKKK